MFSSIKSEFIKEKRSANAKMIFIVPVVFIFFNILLVSIMGRSPSGKSYLMATAFNWYPLIVLPIVISILVININNKEKDVHRVFVKSLGLNEGYMVISKSIIVRAEILAIILLSSVFVYFFGVYYMEDDISIINLIEASVVLFTGSLGITGISFLLYGVFRNKFLIVIFNFIMTFISPIIAITKFWYMYPWDYSTRMLAPVIKVYPNGLFIEGESPFLNMHNLLIGALLSILIFYLCIFISYRREKRK